MRCGEEVWHSGAKFDRETPVPIEDMNQATKAATQYGGMKSQREEDLVEINVLGLHSPASPELRSKSFSGILDIDEVGGKELESYETMIKPEDSKCFVQATKGAEWKQAIKPKLQFVESKIPW
ncbi:unnamed protein product [Linum trigynum]|uniref:Uncharacterized protein n=1 Tax=Linum trigynum TaxID=586398 RepID=A0AAV2FE31_9ROSI